MTDAQTPARAQMTVLAIDTCEGNCAAAIVADGDVLAVRSEAIGRGHAERLLPMLDEMMAEAGLDYSAVDRLAVTTGPGTFTGLRIGLSVARGLGLALGVPVVGVTSLMAFAAAQREAGRVHAVVLGRGGQAYHQAFAVGEGVPVAETVAEGLDAADISARIKSHPGRVVGSGGPLVGAAGAGESIDPVALAWLGAVLDPVHYSPEPSYLRAADAAKAKALLPVE